MSSINKKKNTYKKNEIKRIHVTELMMAIIILVLIAVNLTLVIKNVLVPKAKQENDNKIAQELNNTEEQSNNNSNTTSADYQLSLLQQGTERDRMEYYCGQFFGFIENNQYEKAYELLYPEFKNQYFSTIEDFTKYIQKTYPSLLIITYDDIDRQGDIYILTIKIADALSKNNEKQITQRIVVQESDYNKFVLSFQVI